MNKLKLWLVVVFCFIFSKVTEAQGEAAVYVDNGKNNASEGFYLKSAATYAYDHGKMSLHGGLLFDLVSPGSHIFSGARVKLSRKFMVKGFSFESHALYLYNRFSDLVHEKNWGILLSIDRTHFTCKLGTGFKTYHITGLAGELYNIDSDRDLHEKWNMMYFLGYKLKPKGHEWNTGLAITNTDHFLINQETNPMLCLSGTYNFTPPLHAFVEVWHKSSGTLNISVNHFGFFIRTGIIWKPNLEN
ncbi:MAG: hypothetical protein ACQES1_03885 [Bacteroidota bacterium]